MKIKKEESDRKTLVIANVKKEVSMLLKYYAVKNGIAMNEALEQAVSKLTGKF